MTTVFARQAEEFWAKERRSSGKLTRWPAFYMWCMLLENVDDKQLSRSVAERQILIAPGSAFCPDASPSKAMRINIAHVGDHRFARL
jgi:DNA-binding transcriptional MocR family regulator